MSFRLANAAPGGGVPRIVERSLAAGAAFEKGALLLINGSGEYAECGADPASIAAVAETGAGTDASGFSIIGKKEFPAGKMQGIALTGQTFRSKYVGTLPGSNGGSYGVIRDTDSLWKVDFAEVGATRLKLVGRLTDSPENIPEVLSRFLTANIQDN